MKPHSIRLAILSLSLLALAGCATTVHMDYKGPLQASSLDGKVFALDTHAAKAAQFPPMPGCPFKAKETCRHWVMQEYPTALTYNQVLASALMKSGAKPTGDDAKADFIVKTEISPAPGHEHIIDDAYLLGKSAALGGLTGERYVDQTIHAVYHVTIESHGKIVASLDVPVGGQDQVEWGTFGNASDLDIATREAYRGHLRPLAAKILEKIVAQRDGL
jgi:hypothetical protein